MYVCLLFQFESAELAKSATQLEDLWYLTDKVRIDFVCSTSSVPSVATEALMSTTQVIHPLLVQ